MTARVASSLDAGLCLIAACLTAGVIVLALAVYG